MLEPNMACHENSRTKHIVAIGSVVSDLPVGGRCVYSATKAAIHNFHSALGAEVNEHGNVFVHIVAPGAVQTNFGFNKLVAVADDKSLEGKSAGAAKQGKRSTYKDNLYHKGAVSASTVARKTLEALYFKESKVYVFSSWKEWGGIFMRSLWWPRDPWYPVGKMSEKYFLKERAQRHATEKKRD